jgi:hypothetical protein
MIRRLGFVTILFAITATGCIGGTQVRERFHQAVPAPAAPLVRIDNSVGEVRVKGWQRHTVDIEAIKSASSEEALNNIEIAVQSQGNTITIATKYHGFGNGGVRYVISVPQAASLDVNNSTGTVRIDGVSGNVAAVTQTGEVNADLGRVAGQRSVDLTATTGSVRLTVGADSDARVEAKTSIGDVSSDFDSIVSERRNVVGASASGRIGNGSASIRLTTTTGAISLRRS